MHLVFAASSCYGATKSPKVVKLLRVIVEKWCALGEAPWLLRSYYKRTSGEERRLTSREAALVATPLMTAVQAEKYLERRDHAL